jgi:hypothetical protein
MHLSARPSNLSIAAAAAIALFFTSSLAHAISVSQTTDAFGIEWTLSATSDVDAAYASDWDVMFSVTADVPSDLSLLMDEGETITPIWISTAEARIQGLEDFMLVSAPNGEANWYDYAGPSANGCQNVSGSSACAESMSDAYSADITSGASHTWTWVGNVSNLDAVFAEDLTGLQHIGAHLENERHRNGWNVSEDFSSAVPEPSAALVFGTGITLVALRVRRRSPATA